MLENREEKIHVKFVVWGAGHLGIMLFDRLKTNVVAFIDKDANKIGMSINGVPVISFEEYKKKYQIYYLIISPKFGFADIVNLLQSNNIYRYFILDLESVEVKKSGWEVVWKNLNIVSDTNEGIAIYGLNLTGILLYLYLKELGCKKIYIVAHEGIDERLLASIKEDLRGPIVDSIEMLDFVDKLITVLPLLNKYMENIQIPSYIQSIMISTQTLKKLREKTSSIIDLYSNVHELAIGSWKSDLSLMKCSLKRFKNCHVGQKCFIVGNGPSLDMNDLDKLSLNNSITMGVNSIFVAFSDTKWRPTYYVTADYLQIHLYADELLSMSAKAKFISKLPYDYSLYVNRNNLSKIDRLLHKPMNSGIYRYNLRSSIGISDDFSDICYIGGSIINVCIQLAFYMGFREIYLLGVDFDYRSTRKNPMAYFSDKYAEKEEQLGILSPQNIGNSFGYEEALLGYQMAKEYAVLNGIKIYNVTRGGKLEVFERISIDSVLS